MGETESRKAYLAKRKALYIKNRERIAAQNRERYLKNPEKFKDIRRRAKEKNAEKIKESNREYRRKNKEKIAAWHRNKRIENREEANRLSRLKRANRTPKQRARDLEYAKQYRELNRTRISEYQKSVRDRIRENRKKYHHKKYREDVQYKLLHNLRSRIKNAIKGKGKDSTTKKLIGCSLSEFKQYIENLFIGNMSWDRVLDGSIHIDHKIPCAAFDFTNEGEQKRCFHYTNLQPLWAVDNLKKGAKYEFRKDKRA